MIPTIRIRLSIAFFKNLTKSKILDLSPFTFFVPIEVRAFSDLNNKIWNYCLSKCHKPCLSSYAIKACFTFEVNFSAKFVMDSWLICMESCLTLLDSNVF